jgi:hypothetical protein
MPEKRRYDGWEPQDDMPNRTDNAGLPDRARVYVRCSVRFLDGMGLPFIRKGRCKLYDRIDLDERCSRISAEGGPGRRFYGP